MGILVWVQTSQHRDPSLALESIENSDIGKNYVRVHDDNDWTDHADLQKWWKSQWLSMAELAAARNATLVLRLEDDIAVNRHILHNVGTWDAVNEHDYGYGTLFCPDYWDWGGALHPTRRGNTVRSTIILEGAQGQLLKTKHISEIIQKTDEARDRNGRIFPLSFDWSMSRAAGMLGLKSYVHMPALVNVTTVSLQSSLSRHLPADSPDGHCWGTKQFSPRWRRP